MLLISAVLYQKAFTASLFTARASLKKVARETAWIIAIDLFRRIRLPASARPDGEYTSAPQRNFILRPPIKDLAFAFSEAEQLLAPDQQFGDTVTIQTSLRLTGTSGPAKSMPTGPWYVLSSTYLWYPVTARPRHEPPPWFAEKDPFEGVRFPYELAPPGVFENSYEHPFRLLMPPESTFSASVPQDVFLSESASHVERALNELIDQEIDKWKTVGSYGNCLYFASTLGLGEITPHAPIVRWILVGQHVVLGVLILGTLVPRFLDSGDAT